jgi:cytochrome c
MKKLVMYGMVALVLIGFAGIAAAAGGHATAAETEAMVKKAIAFAKANGTEAALAEINNPKGRFIDRDLYLAVDNMEGTCVAHPINPKMIGKNLMEVKDPDGKVFVKERNEMAKRDGKGWHEYKFTDPITKKIGLKRVYFERYGDLIFLGGFYK